jgi:hypothetical protein
MVGALEDERMTSLRSKVGGPKSLSGDDDLVIVGDRADELRGLLKISYPISHGRVTNWYVLLPPPPRYHGQLQRNAVSIGYSQQLEQQHCIIVEMKLTSNVVARSIAPQQGRYGAHLGSSVWVVGDSTRRASGVVD